VGAQFKVLVVDDQLGAPGSLQNIFRMKYQELPCDFVFESCMTGPNRFWSYKAVERIRIEKGISIVLLDIKFGSENDRLGLEILERIGQEAPLLPVIMLTSLSGETGTIVRAIQLGAKDYVVKDPTPEELLSLLKRYAVVPTDTWELIGESAPMKMLRQSVERGAQYNASVLLITGERGSGKELVARNIARLGPRADKPFVDVNCAAISPELFEAEMFGAQKGSYTGIDKNRFGFLELANGGILFLDEVGEMPKGQQSKLLRAIEQRHFRRIGVSEEISSDFQLICATNADLAERVRTGAFRSDLYDRIRAIEIHTPALRECREDVPALAAHFAASIAGREKTYVRVCTDFSERALAALSHYDWPGNVRELKQAIEYAIFMANGKPIQLEHLRPEIRDAITSTVSGQTMATGSVSGEVTADVYVLWQLRTIRAVFEQTGRNQAATVRRLFPGLKESYFGRIAWDLVRKYPFLLDPTTEPGSEFQSFHQFFEAYERTQSARDRAKVRDDDSDEA
jgi:DNA-binding NtrC family response regulator